MSLTPETASFLMHTHVANTTAPTPRPVSLEPYRTRRRRAGVYRICIALAALAAFSLPLIGSY